MPFRLYNPQIKCKRDIENAAGDRIRFFLGDLSRTTSVVVKKNERSRYNATESGGQRRLQLLTRANKDENRGGAKDADRFASYTIVKPKSQTRLTHELLWQYNRMMHEHAGRYLPHLWHTSATDSSLTPLYPSWSVACIGQSSAYGSSASLLVRVPIAIPLQCTSKASLSSSIIYPAPSFCSFGTRQLPSNRTLGPSA